MNTANLEKELALTDKIRTYIADKLAVSELEAELQERLEKENSVREIKKLGKECRYKKEGYCVDSKFRCGERADGRGDDLVKCVYDPSDDNKFALVVDENKEMRELYSGVLSEHGFKEDNVLFLDNMDDAKKLLECIKPTGKQVGLVICDLEQPTPRLLKKNRNADIGYNLVNHLVERNYNADIILISGTNDSRKPGNYFGDAEVIKGNPNTRVVSSIVEKSGYGIWISELHDAVKESVNKHKPAN
jgi:CheY-like chemotaxis protein